MRKRMTVFLVFLILTATGYCVAEQFPVNPYQKEVWEFDRLVNKMRQMRAVPTGISFLTLQEPSLGQNGIWEIQVDPTLLNEHGEIVRRSVYIQSKDPSGEYSAAYRWPNPADTIESCSFVAPGNYELVALYYFEDRSSYIGRLSIAIKTDEEHPEDEYPTIAIKTEQILRECRVEGDEWQTVLNIHDWLTHHAYYDYSYCYYGAEDILIRGYGVCDSYSKAFWFLMDAANIPHMRAISRNHAWNVIQLENEWYHVDITWDDPGQNPVSVSGNENYNYFCINDELIYGFMDDAYSTHDSEAAVKGICGSLDASYPIHMDEWRENAVFLDENGNTCYYSVIIPEIMVGAKRTFMICADQDYPLFGKKDVAPARDKSSLLTRYLFAYGLNKNGLVTADGDILYVIAEFDVENLLFAISVLGWKNHKSIITIPDNCLRIEDGAFSDSAVSWIEIPNITTALEGSPFEKCNPLMIITPAGSAAAEYAEENGILWMQP